MAFIFTDDLKTGNAQIDNEHMSLINKINVLMDCCSKGEGITEIIPTLNFVLEYTKEHFMHEEMLQKKYNYSDYQNHKMKHEAFIKTIENLAQKVNAQNANILILAELNSHLGLWLVNHIKNEDKKIAQYIKSLNKII